MSQAPLRVSRGQAEAIEALEKGRFDLQFFSREILGVEPNHAARRWFRLIKPKENGWEWRLKAVLHVAANQIGKTLGIAIIILWALYYKIGVPTDDPDAWFEAPYVWYHVAPSQNQAYLPLKDAVLLTKGAHPSQEIGKRKFGLKFRLPEGSFKEVKVETYYDGIESWNGSFAQFRTTEEKAKALQGRRAAGISFDECAFEQHLRSIVNETLMMRLVASGGPIFMVSTPNGINDWFDFVSDIMDKVLSRPALEPGDPDVGGSARVGEPSPVWETEEAALVWSTVEDNVGWGISEAEWARMERDLDPATKEQQLRGAFLEPVDAYFVPSDRILMAFKADMPEDKSPEAGHQYVISWDPSSAADPTVAIVLDITSKPWKGVHLRYYERPLGETRLLMEMYGLHALFNGSGLELKPHEKPPKAITVFDATSMGGAMLRQQLAGMHPKRALNLAGPTMKKTILSGLRAALSTGALHIPRSWSVVLREVLNYKLPDDKLRQDCVMSLAGAADVAARGFSGSTEQNFRPSARVATRRF